MAKKMILTITHSTDDHDRANGAIALATSLLSEGIDLVLFFVYEGAMMAKQGVAETIEGRNLTPVKDLMPIILEAKIPMYLCGACAKAYEISETELVEGVKIISLPTIAAEMLHRELIQL
jgi:uncharacterized protein involved in oxidation of intracellular sulfur